MADLAGVDLAEATAHVLGFRDDDHRWRHSGTFYIHRRPNETMPEEFRPDQGGAAAWEVLEWLSEQDAIDTYYIVKGVDRENNRRWQCDMYEHEGYSPKVWRAYGDTQAEALCRAVVALGEAG